MDYTPNYQKMNAWEIYSRGLSAEYLQCLEEGLDAAPYKAAFDGVISLPDGPEREAMADALFRFLTTLPTRADYPYKEPSDLEEILALRDGWTLPPHAPLTEEALRRKLRGAWYGRVAGCLLGKPVEGVRTEELHPILKATGNFPMTRYIRRSELNEEICGSMRFPFLTRTSYPDCIECAPVDDDTNYTVLYMLLLERRGKDFTPEQAADFWLEMQPKSAYCTAERAAFVNFVRGIRPPASASYKNPYREWIGAQIRADYFGYIHPGDPEGAAAMAWRDASISHVKNGIYGEMFAAAMLAAAAVTTDRAEIVRAGLSQIPATSRLYERVAGHLAAYETGGPAEKAFAAITARWDEHRGHDWCHTISNAEIVTASLLWYGDEYGRAICRAVQCGFDTDCNGATVGSILGMAYGIDAVGEAWTSPLRGRLRTSLFGLTEISLDDAAERTIEQIRRMKQ